MRDSWPKVMVRDKEKDTIRDQKKNTIRDGKITVRDICKLALCHVSKSRNHVFFSVTNRDTAFVLFCLNLSRSQDSWQTYNDSREFFLSRFFCEFFSCPLERTLKDQPRGASVTWTLLNPCDVFIRFYSVSLCVLLRTIRVCWSLAGWRPACSSVRLHLCSL